MSPRSVHAAAAKCLGLSDTKDAALERVVKVIETCPSARHVFGRQLWMKILQTWIQLTLVGLEMTATNPLHQSQYHVVFNQHLQKFSN